MPSPTQKTLDDMRAHFETLPASKRGHYLGRVRFACKKRGVAVPDWAAAALPRKALSEQQPATAVELPEPLTAWRSAAASRVIEIASNGQVVLHTWESGSHTRARFGSPDAAIAAIEAGAIEWHRVYAVRNDTPGKKNKQTSPFSSPC